MNNSTVSSNPDLSVVIPTYNEGGNIIPLINTIIETTSSLKTEIIVVDDSSPDGTARIVREYASRFPQIKVSIRDRKMGLAGAVFLGTNIASADNVCVIDADTSHDPKEIPEMFALLQNGFDLVIGSRFVQGGSLGSQPFLRKIISVVINEICRRLFNIKSKDVLTGFVLCQRSAITEMPTRFSTNGFKFLLEILATQKNLSVCEWPIVFQKRFDGKSKASLFEVFELSKLCIRLFLHNLVRGTRRPSL